uniref:Uncharacterized protein n=1 Tax=Picea glauca TaxID=3330 RepID=A0A101LUW8_PICGL|nr:hypothetical protein ABT39_MTgene2375 [Picea glauca]QHR92244.1 hypothetical protein Q903MT_gene6283 [Picea sitchensis]
MKGACTTTSDLLCSVFIRRIAMSFAYYPCHSLLPNMAALSDMLVIAQEAGSSLERLS